MNSDTVMQLAADAMMLSLKLAGPILVVCLVLGVVISILQAATQVQEATLQYVPKMIALVLVAALAGPWMIAEMTSYTRNLFKSIPQKTQNR